MPPTHTAVIAAISMLLLLVLGVHTSLIRLREKVYYGDGGLPALRKASRAHGVSFEHLMPVLLLLLILELLGAGKAVIDGFGIAILGSRLVQVTGFFLGQRVLRTSAITVTYLIELALALLVLATVSGLA
jgi:uncharacterized membrane protein YecN with MAPEG domain